MKNAINEFSKKSEHRRCHSAVAVVLTHGLKGYLCGTDARLDSGGQLLDGAVDVDEFVSMLNGDDNNCPNLRGKPKLFFLQACRGGMFVESVRRCRIFLFVTNLIFEQIFSDLTDNSRIRIRIDGAKANDHTVDGVPVCFLSILFACLHQ